MKIVYMGSSTTLSYVPLRALIESGRMVHAVIVEGEHEPPSHNPVLPVIVEGSTSLASLALAHGIPLIGLGGDWPAMAEQLNLIAPDVILVSCFGLKLPDNVVSIPRCGCFNLHPSLLPAFRGPAPVFWQFRAGTKPFGISLHCVSAQIDAGDIVAQTRVTIPDGANGQQAVSLLAQAGSRLIDATLRAIECDSLERRIQSHSDASYQGFPTADDYAVSTRWTARRMYNFICATRAPGIVFPCEIGGRTYRLTEAKSYRDRGQIRTAIKDNNISITCSHGVIEAVYVSGGE